MVVHYYTPVWEVGQNLARMQFRQWRGADKLVEVESSRIVDVFCLTPGLVIAQAARLRLMARVTSGDWKPFDEEVLVKAGRYLAEDPDNDADIGPQADDPESSSVQYPTDSDDESSNASDEDALQRKADRRRVTIKQQSVSKQSKATNKQPKEPKQQAKSKKRAAPLTTKSTKTSSGAKRIRPTKQR